MAQFEIDSDTIVRRFEIEDADELFALVHRNRAHLGRWMPFVQVTLTSSDTLLFIESTIKQEKSRNGFQCAIVKGGALVGTIGFHSIQQPNRTTTMGYWITAELQGKGIVTKAVQAMIEHAFSVWNLHRIEIQAAVDNKRSRSIAHRLGFTHEGTLRQAESVGGVFQDMAVYGLLRTEWKVS